MKLNPIRIVEYNSTVTCIARGWKPPAQTIELIKYGDWYDGTNGERFAMKTIQTKIDGILATVAKHSFTVSKSFIV